VRSLGGVIAPPTGTATRPQSTLQQAVLRKLSGVLHLTPPTTGFVIDRRLQVPMRDGVALIADHYVPQTTTPSGTLLVRGPYGRGWPFAAVFGSVYAARGYHVLIQSVRGTFGSGGDFDPFVHEIDDGADTVAWLRDQPWFTGTFATMGLSYLGFTQWALLADPPPEMTAAVITVGPHDVSGPRWGTGSFGINDFLGWSDLVARQEDPRRLRVMLRQARAQRLVTQASLGLPLGESSRALLGEGAPWFESWLEHPQADDAFWKRLHLRDAVQRQRPDRAEHEHDGEAPEEIAREDGRATGGDHRRQLGRFGLRRAPRESVGLILRSEQPQHGHAGTRIQNVAPTRGWLVIPAEPECASATPLTSASPRPARSTPSGSR